jgi:AcrR family transcriptional regulator
MSAAVVTIIRTMARWEPNARGRLEQAALELYGERGFESATVAEIAERARLTERTFFRYFADKREVLFGGAGPLHELLVDAVAAAPDSAPPIEAAATGLRAVAEIIRERRDLARQRQAIIAANPELQERELSKLASWASALADGLRGRGVDDDAATLVGEVAVAVFRIAFQRWLDGPDDGDLAELIGESLDELGDLVAKPAAARQAL